MNQVFTLFTKGLLSHISSGAQRVHLRDHGRPKDVSSPVSVQLLQSLEINSVQAMEYIQAKLAYLVLRGTSSRTTWKLQVLLRHIGAKHQQGVGEIQLP